MKSFQTLFLSTILFIVAVAADHSKVHRRNGLTVKVTDNKSGLSAEQINKMVDVFFKVYPKMLQEFQPKATKEVEFQFDPKHQAPGATSGSKITYSAEYFKKNPKDIDVVTHEAFHVIQFNKNGKTGNDNTPHWMIEAMADYARDRYGVANKEADWKLQDYNPNLKYTDGYRNGFLKFVESKKKGSMKKLFDEIYAMKYSDASWHKLTGKTVEQWWTDFSKSGKTINGNGLNGRGNGTINGNGHGRGNGTINGLNGHGKGNQNGNGLNGKATTKKCPKNQKGKQAKKH